MERWKEVTGHPGYRVSDHGNIMGRRGKIIRGSRDKDGYVTVAVHTRTPSPKTLKAHRLITEAFIGAIPEGMHVNHKNGIKDDNRVENLEIVTPSQNTKHGFAVLGRVIHSIRAKGEQHGNSVLTESDVRRILQLHAGGMSCYRMHKDGLFPVSENCLWAIVKRKNWAHVH